jgi:protein-tyrosine phosphatase
LKRVLFLCTGNYYRSRFAEELFNVLAAKHGLGWQADSAGLEPTPQNPGPISRHTLAACARLGIERPTAERFPRKVLSGDFVTSDLVIAVKEAEHRAMMERSFPEHLSCVEFWHVHDVDCAAPADTIADLERRVGELIDRLKQSESESRPTAA